MPMPVSLHLEARLRRFVPDPHHDTARPRRELDGVVEQVEQQPLEPPRVAVDDRRIASPRTASSMPRACATGSSCSTSDAASPPRSTGAKVSGIWPDSARASVRI